MSKNLIFIENLQSQCVEVTSLNLHSHHYGRMILFILLTNPLRLKIKSRSL